jgi:cytochrome c oxidase subunit 3
LSANHHNPALKHHFDNLEQQQASEKLGMWMFLATEVMFFAGLFVAYTAYRMWYPAEFEFASSKLNWKFASFNTLLLVTSSMTITFAIRASQLGDKKGVYRNLLLTAALGTGFMVVKAFEYKEDVHEKYVPGWMFQGEYNKAAAKVAGMSYSQADEYFKQDDKSAHPEHQHWAKEMALRNHAGSEAAALNPGRVQLFLVFYYVMTGIHGVHLIVGIGCVLWLVFEARCGRLKPDNSAKVEVVSLYWHLVDAIWLFLMPLLYLAGAHLKSAGH